MRPQIIYAVNIEDQIVKRYRSMNECSRVLNITPDVFYRCLKNGDLINDKYLVARSKEELKLLYEERYTVIYLKDIVIEHSNKTIAQPSYAVDVEPPKTEVKDAEQIRQPVITKTPATERQQPKPSTRNESLQFNTVNELDIDERTGKPKYTEAMQDELNKLREKVDADKSAKERFISLINSPSSKNMSEIELYREALAGSKVANDITNNIKQNRRRRELQEQELNKQSKEIDK